MKKLAILFWLAIGAQALLAQEKFNFTFNHMALTVKELSRSVEFYHQVFQFSEITNRTKSENIRWMSMGEDKELHLITNTAGSPIVITKSVHLAFTTPHFDAFRAHLEALKIPYSDWPGKMGAVNVRADGVKQIYIQDPDGYWIEINNGYAAPAK